MYVSTGTGRHIDEMWFSIRSATAGVDAADRPWRIVVYTDDPSPFRELPVHVEHLTDGRVAEWLGGRDYLYRIKIKALQSELVRPGTDRAVLVDGDTYFKRPPEGLLRRIRPGTSVMHALEGWPFDDEAAALSARIAAMPRSAQDEIGSYVGPRRVSWNAGVVGLDALDVGLLDDVLRVSDLLVDSGFDADFHTAEQIAFATVLNRATRVREARDWVEHYWHGAVRDPFDAELARARLLPGDEAEQRRRFEELWERRPTQGRTYWGRMTYLRSRLSRWGIRR